jgi:hypothetical protein
MPKYEVVVLADCFIKGKQTQFSRQFEKNFPNQEIATQWGRTVADTLFPKNKGWGNQGASATLRTKVIQNTKEVEKGELTEFAIPIDDFIEETLTAAPTPTTPQTFPHPLANLRADQVVSTNREEVVEALQVRSDASTATAEPPAQEDESVDTKPERLQAIAYAWWNDHKDTIPNNYSAWYQFPPLQRAELVLRSFMLDKEVQVFCKEVYSLEGDIKRHALEEFQKYCTETAAA